MSLSGEHTPQRGQDIMSDMEEDQQPWGQLAKEYGKPTFKTIGEVNQAMNTKVGEPPSGGSTPPWGIQHTLLTAMPSRGGCMGL